MNINEINHKLDKLSSNLDQFKKVSETKQLESKGSEGLNNTNLKQISEVLKQQQNSIVKLETALSRPSSEQKSSNVVEENTEYKQAFCSYIRSGSNKIASVTQRKGLSTNDNSGYLTTTRISDHVSQLLHTSSPMRQICNITEISTDAYEIIKYDMEKVADWTDFKRMSIPGEHERIAKHVIPVHELFAQPKASQKLVDDPTIDIEKWFADCVSDAFSQKENEAFLHGNGKGKPFGLLVDDQIEVVKSGIDGDFDSDSLMLLMYSLLDQYAVNGKFLVSRDVMQRIRMLKSKETGQYLCQQNLNNPHSCTLFGAEVIQCAEMPSMDKGSISIAYGDFNKAYQIVDRGDMRVIRDPYTDKPFIKFYTTKRVGGGVVQPRAIKLMELSK